MQAIYSTLSEDERRILDIYHQRVNQSELKLKSQESTESNANMSFRSEAPLKVLQTKVFNDSGALKNPLEPKELITQKRLKQSLSPGKKKIIKRPALNDSRNSSKPRSSSRASSKKSLKIKRSTSAVSQIMDITKMPNWKYELNKLIRTVFRHSVLCSGFKQESAKIGGLRVLEEYKKFNKIS